MTSHSILTLCITPQHAAWPHQSCCPVRPGIASKHSVVFHLILLPACERHRLLISLAACDGHVLANVLPHQNISCTSMIYAPQTLLVELMSCAAFLHCPHQLRRQPGPRCHMCSRSRLLLTDCCPSGMAGIGISVSPRVLGRVIVDRPAPKALMNYIICHLEASS